MLLPSGVYIRLAERYHWTQEQVDTQDYDYIQDLMLYLDARNEYDAQQQEQRRREAEIEKAKQRLAARIGKR